MTLVDSFPCKKLEMRCPNSRHACLEDVMPHVEGMTIIVVLNDAYLDDERVRSIQELKRITDRDSLAKLKAEFVLTEGEKVLPNSLIKAIEGLSDDIKTLNVQRDDCGDKEYWKIDFPYLKGGLLEPFDDPVGAFTIVPENEGWLIHTRDDEPWIYCLLPEQLARGLLDSEPDIAEEIINSFPYS